MRRNNIMKTIEIITLYLFFYLDKGYDIESAVSVLWNLLWIIFFQFK